MKKFSKILVAVLALALIVGALALAVFANDENKIENPYIVSGVGYDTWADAISAANNTATIYINGNVSLDETISVSGEGTSVTLNLAGNSITANHTAALFDVSEGATLTIKGAGAINNLTGNLVNATGSSGITVDGTGAGITINFGALDSGATATAFRVYDSSRISVSGKVVMNTVNGARVMFNLAATADDSGASALTVKNAKLTLNAHTGASQGTMFYFENNTDVAVTIADSNIEAVYALVMKDGTASVLDIKEYYEVTADGETNYYNWKADTLADAKANLDIADSSVKLTATDSKFTSTLGGFAEAWEDNNSMFVLCGKAEAKFDGCIFYAGSRMFRGADDTVMSEGGASNTQITFNDCHAINNGEGNADDYVSCCGINMKWIGGSIYDFKFISAGQAFYLDLDDEEGARDEWIGSYIDNVLLKSVTNCSTVITGAWDNAFSAAPGAQTCGIVKRIVDGTEYTFKSGYFSDESTYYTYINDVATSLKISQDCNTAGSSLDIALSTGTYGTVTQVNPADDSKGNGYMKVDITSNIYANDGKNHRYNDIRTPATQLAETDLVVMEFDTYTEGAGALFPSFYIPLRVRYETPKFDEAGNYIGYEKNNNDVNSTTIQFVTGSNSAGTTNRIKFNNKTRYNVDPNTWHRITLVFDIVKTETTLNFNPYVNGTKDTSKTITKQAYDISKSKLHVYIDGTYLGSQDFGASINGGKIVSERKADGSFAQSCYVYNARSYFYKGQSAGRNMRFDNYRYSAYNDAYTGGEHTAYDFGLYKADGTTPVDSIIGSKHFSIMPDNNTTDFTAITPPPAEPTYVAKVDGVGYETEEAAVAAIQSGSTLELLSDLTSPIETTGDVPFKVITNGYEFAGVKTLQNKVVDYSGAIGAYLVAPAEAGDFYNVLCFDERLGYNKTIAVPEGAVFSIPEGAITPAGEGKPGEGFYWYVTSWKHPLGNTVVDGFYADKDRNIALVAEYSKTPYFYEITAGGATNYYDEENASAFDANLSAALANGEVSVLLWADVSSNGGFTVDGKLSIDLNGNELAVNAANLYVFNLLPGTELELFSANGAASVDASGAVIAYSEYDRSAPSAISVNIGNEENELSVIAASLAWYLDKAAADTYEYTEAMTLNINKVSLTSELDSDAAVITASAPLTVNASELNYSGVNELVIAFSDHASSFNASFAESSIVTSADNAVKAPGANRSVSFNDTRISAKLKAIGGETITLGLGCDLLAADGTIESNGIKVDDGCAWAYAAYDGVKYYYIDEVGNFAKITWYNAKGEAIGTNYNAPYGKPFEVYTEEEASRLVGLAVGTDWYDVGFERWNIPEDKELTAGEHYHVYPVCETPYANVKGLKVNLAADMNFKLNFYLPAELSEADKEIIESFELCGIYTELPLGAEIGEGDVEINGTYYRPLSSGDVILGEDNYKVYSGEWLVAYDASVENYHIIFEVDGQTFVDTVEYGVPTYAKSVMADENATDDVKTLVMNMISYANYSSKLITGASVSAYDELIANIEYSAYLTEINENSFSEAEKNASMYGVKDYMAGATFEFGTYQPQFFFKYQDTALPELVKPDGDDGKIGAWPTGNRGVFTHVYHESFDGTESYNYIAPQLTYDAAGNRLELDGWDSKAAAYVTTIDISVRDLTEVINVAVYKPDATVARGSYSLAKYILFLDGAIAAETDAALRESYEDYSNAAKAIYAFSLAVQNVEYATVAGK